MLTAGQERKVTGVVGGVIGLGCIVLLQLHAVEFWSEVFGNRIQGIAFSVWVEISALWLWMQNSKGLKFAGFLCTCAILSCSLFHTATPLFKGLEENTLSEANRHIQIEELNESIATLQGQNKTFLINSKTRGGWGNLIEENNNKIKELEAEKKALQNSNTEVGLKKEEVWFKVGVKALVLILFQIVAVASMLSVKEAFKNRMGRPAATKNKTPNKTVKK